MILAFLQDWTREIVVLLVLALIIDMALPNTSIRRYVDYSMSLILLLLLLGPMMQILSSPPDMKSLLGAAQLRVAETHLSHTELSNRSAWLAYKLLLEERVEHVATDLRGVVACSAEAFIDQNSASLEYGMPNNLTINLKIDPTLDQEQELSIVENVKQSIHITFGLKPENVRIHIKR